MGYAGAAPEARFPRTPHRAQERDIFRIDTQSGCLSFLKLRRLSAKYGNLTAHCAKSRH